MSTASKGRILEFEIPGRAVPLKSPRFFFHRGTYGVGAYIPKQMKDWQANIAFWASQEVKKQKWELTDSAVIFDCEVGIKRKPHQKKWQYPKTKPDRSNWLKPIEDALEGIVYTNDSRIVDGRTRKIFADRNYVRIKVTTLID